MNGAAPPRVAVVEDHPLFRETITSVIEAMPAYRLDGVYASAEEALAALPEDQPDVVLVDLSLTGMSGTELVEHIGARWPQVLCVVLSGHRQPHYAQQALSAGARGFILKGSPAEFREGLRRVLAGETFVSAAAME